MNKMKYLLIALFSVLVGNSFGQFIVTQNDTAMALAQKLAGAGVIVDTAWLTCPTLASGIFSGAQVGLGFTDGVLLTTGDVLDVNGAPGGVIISTLLPNAPGQTTDNDSDLDALFLSVGSSTTQTHDACALEFDITVAGDSVSFEYAFGSEEYTNWVCSNFNDIFAFYFTGPNPAGGVYPANNNLALVPGTSIPVTVNTVNGGTSNGTNPFCNLSNSAYFQPGIPGIAFDGMTQGFNDNTISLVAGVATVPCQSYHFKMVIADGQDESLDSGVFLKAGSFTSSAVIIGASSVLGAGFNEAIEGCVDGIFNLEIDTPFNFDVWVHYDISGTAINGTDYATILDSVLVLAGDTTVLIPINVFSDGITEGTETVILTPYTACGTLGNPSVLNIIDDFPHGINLSNNVLCGPSNITLTGYGAQFYSWSDSTLLNNFDSIVATTINPLTQTTTFYLDGELGTCNFTDTATVYVSQSAPIFHTQDISCAGANDGAYWIELNDSAAVPFTYNFLILGVTDSFATNISPSFQIVSVIDSFGCTFTDFYNFTNPAALTSTWDTTSISCAGANDGEICLSGIVNGTYTANIDTNGVLYSNYTFTIANDTFCFGPLGADSFDVVFTNDTTGCSGSFSATLSEPVGMSYSYDTINVSCANANDGSICIYNVLNGNYTANVTFNGMPLPPYNFIINSDTFCVDNLMDGYYDINLVNTTTLCNANFTVHITAPNPLVANIGGVGASLCAGGSIDSLVTIVAGGTMPYTYLWSNTATTSYLLSPAPGSYSVIITDQNLCVDTATYTIATPIPMFLTITQDSVLCFGEATGVAFVDSISGGLAPYTYAWNDLAMQTTDTATNVIAGQIILTVTDANSCIISDTTTVLQPSSAISLSLSSNLITCFGGDTCIDATVSGGTMPYTFLWNDALAQTTEDICGLVAGTYTLTVTDANGCTKIDSITIAEEPEIVLTIDSTNIMCYGMAGGSATVTAVGGSGAYTYLWDDAIAQTTAVANSLVAGFYTVVVADAADATCTKTISVNVIEPTDSILIVVDSITDVSCYGTATGQIDVSISGGTLPYTFAWSNASTTEDLSNALAGIHTLTVTDDSGCSMSITETIAEPDSMTIVLSTNVIDCFGGDTCINTTITGGNSPYTYLWNDALAQTTKDVCGLIAGSYILTVTDSTACVQSESIVITEVTEIVLSIDSTNILCFGDSNGIATVTAVGGSGTYTYLWNDALGQTTSLATNLAPGFYSVVVSDALNANCSKTISVHITEPAAALSATLASLTNVLCFGASTGSIDVNISGGTIPYSFAWSNTTSNEDLISAVANSYSLTVTDANLCTTTYSDVISQPLTALDIVPVTTTDVSCFGGNNGAIDVNIVGGTTPYVYSWSNSATTEDIFSLTQGSYVLTVTDSNNCVSTETIVVNEPANVSISFTYSNYNGSNVSCFEMSDGTITAAVTGGNAPFTYAWDNAMTGSMISGISANTVLTVTVTDDNGCVYTQAANALTEPSVLTVAKDSTNVSCAGYNDGTATALPSGGTAPYTYLWSDPLAQSTATATNLVPNTYTCNVSDVNGCISSIQVTISEADVIVVTATVDSVRCWGDSDGTITVLATGGNGNDFEYSIDGGLTYQAGSVFTALAAGVYDEIIVKQDGSGNCLSVPVSATIYEPQPMFVFINPGDTIIQIQESVPMLINVDPATGYYAGTSYSTSDITNISWTPITGLNCTDCLNPTALVYDSETEYTATVIYSPYGCVTEATAIINVENNLKYFIPNGFSPQGDGVNDVFKVYGEALKDFYLIINNRWGEKIFESTVQSQGWDGTYQGKELNPGVYSFYFEGVYLDGKEITKKGSLTLLK